MHIANAPTPAARTLRIQASQPQHTEAGRLLGKLYYGGFLERTLQHGVESFGYPHNGGEHTLSLRLPAEDAQAWLTLLEESYAGHPGLADFTAKVRSQLH